jgi:segregation and condensation protein B
MPQELDESSKRPLMSVPDDHSIDSDHSVLDMTAKPEDSSTGTESSSDVLPSLNTSEPDDHPDESPSVVDVRPTPRQIIEACLFVGGTPLTSNRISVVLRGEFDSDFVDREINELNRLYAVEERPYEIRLGEGGYRLALRDEFERIRHKVYGLGPKEVRLSQEALEVLAVVAYHQPVRQARVEELGKPGCGPILRQLVRRELIAIARDPQHPKDVNYKTTARFLSLFGIGSLDELPRHEQVTYK